MVQGGFDIYDALTLLGAFAGGLFSTYLFHLIKYIKANKSLDFSVETYEQANSQLQVINNSVFTLKNVIAYMTVENLPTDVAEASSNHVFINETNRQQAKNGRLCWSASYLEGKNPPMLDIYPGEKQELAICGFFIGIGGPTIEIPSEEGFGTGSYHDGINRKSRVFLKGNKPYSAILSILAEDIKRRDIQIMIHPIPEKNRCEIEIVDKNPYV